MDHAAPRRLFALILGAFLALGIGLSGAQAAGVTTKATITIATAAPADHPCTRCGSGKADQVAGHCHPACSIAAAALLPSAPVLPASRIERSAPPADAALAGHLTAPDPSPPKASFLA